MDNQCVVCHQKPRFLSSLTCSRRCQSILSGKKIEQNFPSPGENFCQVPGCNRASYGNCPGCCRDHSIWCNNHQIYKSKDTPPPS